MHTFSNIYALISHLTCVDKLLFTEATSVCVLLYVIYENLCTVPLLDKVSKMLLKHSVFQPKFNDTTEKNLTPGTINSILKEASMKIWTK
jgi:hypothetical protein